MIKDGDCVNNIINIFGVVGIYIFCCIIGQPLVIWISNIVNEFSLKNFNRFSFDNYFIGEEFLAYLLIYSPLVGMCEICGLILFLVCKLIKV